MDCSREQPLTPAYPFMFSNLRLPQTLGAPFGILGDEAKLRFRSQPTGISKLASVRVRYYLQLVQVFNSSSIQNIPLSDSYWDQVSYCPIPYSLFLKGFPVL